MIFFLLLFISQVSSFNPAPIDVAQYFLDNQDCLDDLTGRNNYPFASPNLFTGTKNGPIEIVNNGVVAPPFKNVDTASFQLSDSCTTVSLGLNLNHAFKGFGSVKIETFQKSLAERVKTYVSTKGLMGSKKEPQKVVALMSSNPTENKRSARVMLISNHVRAFEVLFNCDDNTLFPPEENATVATFGVRFELSYNNTDFDPLYIFMKKECLNGWWNNTITFSVDDLTDPDSAGHIANLAALLGYGTIGFIFALRSYIKCGADHLDTDLFMFYNLSIDTCFMMLVGFTGYIGHAFQKSKFLGFEVGKNHHADHENFHTSLHLFLFLLSLFAVLISRVVRNHAGGKKYFDFISLTGFVVSAVFFKLHNQSDGYASQSHFIYSGILFFCGISGIIGKLMQRHSILLVHYVLSCWAGCQIYASCEKVVNTMRLHLHQGFGFGAANLALLLGSFTLLYVCLLTVFVLKCILTHDGSSIGRYKAITLEEQDNDTEVRIELTRIK
eukprot:g1667.t1